MATVALCGSKPYEVIRTAAACTWRANTSDTSSPARRLSVSRTARSRARTSPTTGTADSSLACSTIPVSSPDRATVADTRCLLLSARTFPFPGSCGEALRMSRVTASTSELAGLRPAEARIRPLESAIHALRPVSLRRSLTTACNPSSGSSVSAAAIRSAVKARVLRSSASRSSDIRWTNRWLIATKGVLTGTRSRGTCSCSQARTSALGTDSSASRSPYPRPATDLVSRARTKSRAEVPRPRQTPAVRISSSPARYGEASASSVTCTHRIRRSRLPATIKLRPRSGSSSRSRTVVAMVGTYNDPSRSIHIPLLSVRLSARKLPTGQYERLEAAADSWRQG